MLFSKSISSFDILWWRGHAYASIHCAVLSDGFYSKAIDFFSRV